MAPRRQLSTVVEVTPATAALLQGIRNGDRSALARAITFSWFLYWTGGSSALGVFFEIIETSSINMQLIIHNHSPSPAS